MFQPFGFNLLLNNLKYTWCFGCPNFPASPSAQNITADGCEGCPTDLAISKELVASISLSILVSTKIGMDYALSIPFALARTILC